MKIENIFLSMLLFTLVFSIFGYSLYGKMAATYDIPMENTSLGRMTNSLKDAYVYSDNMKQDIQGQSTDTDAIDAMVKGGYTAVRVNPFSMATTAYNATTILNQELGIIDPFFISIFYSFITISLIFAILYLIFRFFPPK